MRFFTALLAGAAMVSMAVALTFNSVPISAVVGVPEVITYGGNGGNPVTINLLKGPSNNLQLVAVLTSTTTSGSYTWTPDYSLVDGNDYALSIVQGDVINYSAQFPVTGASANVSPSPSPSVSATPTPTAAATATASASASVFSIVSSTIASANPSVTAIPTPLSNTTTSSSYASGGTGTSMPRNTTMSMATLTASSTAAGSITGDPRGGDDATETGGFLGATTSIVMSTGGANILASSLAMIIGIFAAVMYLN